MTFEQAIISDLAKTIYWEHWHSTTGHSMQYGRPAFSGRTMTHRIYNAEHESRCKCSWHVFTCSCGFSVKDSPYYAIMDASEHFRSIGR